MALWKASVSQRTLSACPNDFQILLRSLLCTISVFVIISNVGYSHAIPASAYLLESKAGAYGGGGGRANGESGSKVIYSVETSVVSFGVLISLVVFAVLCTGGCCLKIFGKRRGEEIPTTGFSNPVADLGNSATTISPIDVRALEMNPIIFEPLPAVQDLTPGSTNFYNSLHRIDSSVRYPRHLSPDSQSSYLGIGAATAIVPSDESNIYAHDWFDEPYRNFPRGHIEYVKEVGKGWFGKVIEAEAEDIVPFTKKLRVLVKVLREDATGTEQMRFLDESRLYRDANHGNVLKLLGHSIETLPFLLIMEHCPQGDLKSFLIANVARAELLNTQGALIRMALDIAKGLEWMASADFIHKDLAARNCQVGSEGRVIIGDYGLATQTFRDDYYWGQHVAIPLRWLAPETLHCTINTIQTLKVLKSSNVWTFGVVVWEICEFGKLPYYELSDDDVISRVITDRNYILGQLTRPGLMMKDQLYKIMLSCWNPRFESRPTMSTIVEQMEVIFNEINSNSATSTPSTAMTPTVSGVRSTKDDFDKRWEDLGLKVNSPRDPEEVYSPSWDGSPNNGGANYNITGLSKKKSVTFVGMEEELPNVQIKVGNTFSVQQNELPVALKHPGTPQATILESQSTSLSHINHNHIEKSLKNVHSVSETGRDTNTSSLVLLPQSDTVSKESREIVDVLKVSGDTEDEGWRQRIELGEISQKVQKKSQTVQDLMVLTHVEPSELSDPESLVTISQGQVKKPPVTINPSFNSSSLSLIPSSFKTISSSVINNNSGSLQKTKTETPLQFSPTNVSKLMNSPNTPPKSSEGSDSSVISTSVWTVSKLEPSSSAHGTPSSTAISNSTSATGELSKFEFTALSSVILKDNNPASSDVLEKTINDLNSLDCSNFKNNTSNTVPFLNTNNAAADLDHTRRTVTTNLDDCSGLSMDFDRGNKLNLNSKASFHRSPAVPESNLNPVTSISNRIDVSINSNSETPGKVDSTFLPSSGNEARSDLASKEIHSSSSTSHKEQLSEPNDDIVNIQKSLSVSPPPSLYAVSNAQSNLSNGGSRKRESSSFHISDSTKTLTSHAPSHETIINLISPTPNNMVTVNSIQNGVAKPNCRMNKTETFSEKVISADGHSPVVSFVLTNKEIPAKMMGEGISEAAKNKKIPFRLRKTSTPNKSPGLNDESCGTIDSDFFQRSDDIFEDFSMELSEHLSPIKKAQGVPQSLLTSNVSTNYNHFQVLMGPSEDLGLKPYQRVTTQIEREMSRSNNGNRDFSDYQNEPTGNKGMENNDQSETFSDAHSSDMWYCTDESNLEQPVKSKSGFNDIFGAGRPHGDTPVYQGTFTPEAESSAEKENKSSQSKPAVARKLLFQSDASFWDRTGSANSTGNVLDANDVSRISAQNPAGTWDTFKSPQNETTMNLTSSSSYEKDSQSDKCVTVLKKPCVEVSSDEKVRVLEDDDTPDSEQPSFQPQFKLGHGTGNAQTTSLGLTGNETKGKDTFVEDIETAVEEFGSLVLADLEEEDSKVEVIKETREDESFDGKYTGSSIIRVPRHAFSETRRDDGGTSSTEGDSLIIPSYDALDEHSESEVSVLNAATNISKEFSKDPEEKSLITDLDDSDNGEEDENDDENICREFVPSKWNQNLAPIKPAIKSPEQQKAREASSTTTPSGSSTFEKSGLKKSVSFERVRKKTQLVYEYPPPPPASSDSDDEEKHAKVIGSAGGSLSSSLDWELQPEDVENTDVPLDDWEEEFTQSRTDNPMDMYRFSGFENFQVRPSAEPFAFHRVPSTLATSAQSLELSAPPLTNFLPHSSVASAATTVGTSTLGELRHTRSRLKLDLSKGEASLLDSERLAGGDITKLATTTVQQVDSGVGSISSTNVSPFTQCDNYNN